MVEGVPISLVEMRAELDVFVRTVPDARVDLRRIADHFGMPVGRRWEDIPEADIVTLYRFSPLGKEPLPARVSDEAFDEGLPF